MKFCSSLALGGILALAACSLHAQPPTAPAVMKAVPVRSPLPATDDGLPGAGPLRRAEWFQKLWNERRTHFAAQAARFSLPLDVSLGTPFQQSVWERLRAIPYGVTQRYGEIARYLGQPAASRAVGAAVGRNPLSIIVPCHRVVGSKGALTGYAGGLERKIALLQLEKAL